MRTKQLVWCSSLALVALLTVCANVALAGYSFNLTLTRPPTQAGDSVEITILEVGSRPADLKNFDTYLVKSGTQPTLQVGSQSAKSTKNKLSPSFRNPPGPGTYYFHVKAVRQNPATGDYYPTPAATGDTAKFTFGSASAPAKPKVDLASDTVKLFVEVPPIGNTDRWLPHSVWALGVKTAIGVLSGKEIVGVATHDVQLTDSVLRKDLRTPVEVRESLNRLPHSRFTLVSVGQGHVAASGQTFRIPNANGESITPDPNEKRNIVAKGSLVPIKVADITKNRVFVEVLSGPNGDRWLAQAVWLQGIPGGPIAIRGSNPVIGGKIPQGTILMAHGQRLTTGDAVRKELIKLPAKQLWLIELGQGSVGAAGGTPRGGKVVVAKGEENKNILEKGELAMPLVTIDLGLGTLLARHKNTTDYIVATKAGAPFAALVGGFFVWFPLPVNVRLAREGKTVSRQEAFALIQQREMWEGNKSEAGLVAAGGGNVVPTGAGSLVDHNGASLGDKDGASLVAAGGGNFDGVLKAAAHLVAAGGGNLVAAGGGNLVAAGGGNLVAAGGGNLVAAGGGNLVAAGGGNLVAAGGGNILPTFKLVAAGGGNLVAAGGGNFAVLKNHLSAFLPDMALSTSKVIFETKRVGSEVLPTNAFVFGRVEAVASFTNNALQVSGTNPPNMRYGLEKIPTADALSKVPMSHVLFVAEGQGIIAAQGKSTSQTVPHMVPGAIKGLKTGTFQQPATLGEALKKKALGARFEVKT